jgi:hypothetical protein
MQMYNFLVKCREERLILFPSIGNLTGMGVGRAAKQKQGLGVLSGPCSHLNI